jgi:hypothetical protein
MLYYVTFQIDRSIKLEISDNKDFIHSFAEETTTPTGIGKKYFHNKNDGLIYGYYAGGKCEPTSSYKYSEDEAERVLLELALEHANQNPAGEFMFLPTSDPKVLIADIEEYLADYDSDNQTLIESLEKILNQLKSIS